MLEMGGFLEDIVILNAAEKIGIVVYWKNDPVSTFKTANRESKTIRE
jgi:hypothetical protein